MEEQNVLEKITVILPESEGVISTDNVLDIKSFEKTGDICNENSEGQNISDTENTTVQGSQANGDSLSYEYSKEEEKQHTVDLISLNDTVSQEFKNQVIECIEAVQMSTENSNDTEYLDMIAEDKESMLPIKTAEEIDSSVHNEHTKKIIEHADESKIVQEHSETSETSNKEIRVCTDEENSNTPGNDDTALIECPLSNLNDESQEGETTIAIDRSSDNKFIDEKINEEIQEAANTEANDKDDSFIFNITDSSETELPPSNDVLTTDKSDTCTDKKVEEQDSKCESSKDVSQKPVESSNKSNDNNKAETCDIKRKEEESVDSQLNVTHELEKMGCGSNEISNLQRNKQITNESTQVVPEKQRNVIQDIFDDWQDEALEEENVPVSTKGPDSVELELKNLLQEDKTTESTAPSRKNVKVQSVSVEKHSSRATIVSVKHTQLKKVITQPVSSFEDEDTKNKSCAEIVATIKTDMQNTTTISGRTSKVTKEIERKPEVQTMKSTIKGRLMTSQLSSPVVNEVIKERLREKQKTLDPPGGVDVVFVKKLTQRLSHKLGAVSSSGMLPFSQSTVPACTDTLQKHGDVELNTQQKPSNSDNKELLAILEGDVDPDWSNLKSPIVEEAKEEQNTSNKLDPTLERELALKQLLELPGSSVKKRRKNAKTTSIKETTEKGGKSKENESVSSDKNKQTTQNTPVKSIPKEEESERKDESVQQQGEELRSGRKRKLTEKAREHEQSFTQKRQKYSKKANTQVKKIVDENSTSGSISSGMEQNDSSNDSALPVKDKEDISNSVDSKIPVNKQTTPIVTKKEKTKQSVRKLDVSPTAKRKVMLRKLVQENNPKEKKLMNAKVKMTGKRAVSKAPPATAVEVLKPKKKTINEIERLLQDEGVVNILYDVEQTDRKRRLVPITKSQTKVMDIEKAERELKQRKKMVRNAVLSLRTSNSMNVLSRSKRHSGNSNDLSVEQKSPDQKLSETKQKDMKNSDVILLPKFKNSADDSVIIRRHSTSSYSSAPGSPRIFLHDLADIEAIEDISKKEDIHITRSTKRKLDKDDKEFLGTKRKKRKNISDDMNMNDIFDDQMNEKETPVKKTEKSLEETKLVSSANKNITKVTTRSNVSKIMSARKRGSLKNNGKDTTINSGIGSSNSSDKTHDELSVVLAETATALSTVSGRPGSSLGPRKSRGSTNSRKQGDAKFDNLKIEAQNLFPNKEINVRRHGKLVQLILTPSSSSKLRNGISLQMMQEFRDVLSILKADTDCHVVILTSTGTSFCEGIEIGILLHSDKEERRKYAENMANGVKEFIKSLASFNKPIVAGVQGAAVGLGVTMLPLFDLVIASDKATFSTPYGELGQIPEGASVISLSHTLGSAFANELLLGGRTMTASEALTAGLVTRVLWPDRFQVELLPSLKAMSDHSLQSMEATKSVLRQNLRQKLDEILESETKLLIQHWCSTECQEAIKTYLDEKVQ